MCEGTVRSVLDAVTSDIGLIDTRTGLIVSEMVASLCVACRPVKVGTTGGEMGGKEVEYKEGKREKERREGKYSSQGNVEPSNPTSKSEYECSSYQRT